MVAAVKKKPRAHFPVFPLRGCSIPSGKPHAGAGVVDTGLQLYRHSFRLRHLCLKSFLLPLLGTL